MRLIDADKLKACYTGFNGLDDKADYLSIRTMIDSQPTIDISESNKMYALGILADVMAKANYIITLEDGTKKLCIDTDIIDAVISDL